MTVKTYWGIRGKKTLQDMLLLGNYLFQGNICNSTLHLVISSHSDVDSFPIRAYNSSSSFHIDGTLKAHRVFYFWKKEWWFGLYRITGLSDNLCFSLSVNFSFVRIRVIQLTGRKAVGHCAKICSDCCDCNTVALTRDFFSFNLETVTARTDCFWKQKHELHVNVPWAHWFSARHLSNGDTVKKKKKMNQKKP